MATIPDPATFVAGTAPTEAQLNSLTVGIDFLLGVPVASVYSAGSIGIPTGSTGDTIGFDSEESDTDGVHSITTNNHLFTIVTPGVYVAVLQFVWQIGATNQFFTDVRVNATISGTARIIGRDIRPWITSSSVNGSAGSITTRPVRLAAGDNVYGRATHGGAGVVNLAGGQYGGTTLGLYFQRA